MTTAGHPDTAPAAQSAAPSTKLARHTVGLPGVLFQSVTFMAPGGAVATSLAVGAVFAGGALPLSVLLTMIAAIVIAASIAQLARHLPSAGSIYTYPAQGLHPVVGFLVGWGYALITGLVGPIVNLLIGYFVGTILNTEFGWNFKAMWLLFMLLSAALTALLGYRGVKLGTRFGIALGAFEILVFVLLSFWLLAHAAPGGLTFSVFTLKYATVKGFHGTSGLIAGSIYVFLAFVGFEAAAPLAEEAREPRRTVPRAVLLSCLIIGVFYLFTTVAAAAYVGPAHLQTYGGLDGGSPWILFARQLWGWGWVIVFLAVVNSFFANGNSALIASTRTWYAMGRIRLLPGAFERTSPRYSSPVVGIAAQTLLTLVIALPLALHYGPVTAFELLATILTAVMLGIYIIINLSSIGYYLRKQRAEFNWFLHLVLPAAGALILIPVLAAAVGVGSSLLKFVSPLPYPISEAGLAVGIWFLIGLGYLGYLLARHPRRISEMGEVFE
ncbi:MAG TPA: APC family permease [Streptosporangiaceae bacterium]|nr:APC family permease [Streptosporangiaceae bacterium]